MKRNSKGQSALEFIMTYGWAILVVLVMIGALAYFGVLSPKNYLPDRCTMGAGMNCKDYQVTETAAGSGKLRVQMNIENKGGSTIKITAHNVTYLSGTSISNSACTAPAANQVVSTDAAFAFDCDMGAGTYPGKGVPVKFTYSVTYQDVQGVYPHVINGELQTKTN
jgi:hypothetical protein